MSCGPVHKKPKHEWYRLCSDKKKAKSGSIHDCIGQVTEVQKRSCLHRCSGSIQFLSTISSPAEKVFKTLSVTEFTKTKE